MTLYAKAVVFLMAGTVGWAVMNSPLGQYWPRALSLHGYGGWLALPGLLLGLAEAQTLDGTARRWAIGLGVAGSLIGIPLAERIAWYVMPYLFSVNRSFSTYSLIKACIEFALIGLLMGLFLSLPRRSFLSAVQYALGGFLGGLCGFGLMLLIVRPLWHMGVPHTVTNFIPFALAAFGIGIVPALFKQTWLTDNGKWRRDHPLVRQTVTLGSAQNADVRVPNSPEVAPMHAIIELLPGLNRWRLRHVAGGTGTHAFPATWVNGRAVTGEQWLSDGDTVQIGARAWTFHDRATRGEMRLGPAVPEAWQRSVATGGRQAAEETSPAPALPPRGGILSTGQVARDIGRVGTRLVCTDGPYTGRVYRLGPGETRVGSASSCAVSLPADAELSPVHARLLALPTGGHRLEAAKTDGGTWVNGARLTGPHALLPGDLVQIGTTTLRYQ